MKERPIIFAPEHAQKVHDGRKTQTRRVVKGYIYDDFTLGHYHPLRRNHRGEDYSAKKTFGLWGDGWDIPCPYGGIGDQLWVRETWAHRLDLEPGSEKAKRYILHKGQGGDPKDVLNWPDYGGMWKSGRVMPRWACRTVVELTDVRVERVQDLSEEDALAEGCEEYHFGSGDGSSGAISAASAYVNVWESIHGHESWERNDWVWVLTFERGME